MEGDQGWPPKPQVLNSLQAKKWQVDSILVRAFAKLKGWTTLQQTSRHYGAYHLAQAAQQQQRGQDH